MQMLIIALEVTVSCETLFPQCSCDCCSVNLDKNSEVHTKKL